jgi:hypothetical protein
MREITRKQYIKNREEFILDKCKDKIVLHLGCCDSPYTEFKFNKGTSLFQRIESVCKEQKGLDIDTNSIRFLNESGYKNISFYDLNVPKDIDFQPDVVVFGETLEHLMNLEVAITSLKKLMNKNTELIITVPNATMFWRVIGSFRGVIKEHEDHKVSFTYPVLRQLLAFNQLSVNSMLFAEELNIDGELVSSGEEALSMKVLRVIYNFTYKIIVPFFPLFAECLIVVCKIDRKTTKINRL